MAALLKAGGWSVVNIDATLIAQAPRVGPYRGQMESNLAAVLGVEADRVDVYKRQPGRRPAAAGCWGT